MSLHPADPVYTLDSTGSGPSSPSGDGPPKRQLVFLAAGLVVFALLWVVPAAFIAWLFGSVFGAVGIAELLERTRGLAPTTYGGAFWLAVTITIVMVVLEVRAMLRPATERRLLLVRFITRPSTAMMVLIVPTILLVRWDIRGLDIPDILTTTLLLCCLGYVALVLPLGLLSVAWRLNRWLWGLGRRSGFMAGVLGTFGLLFGTCGALTCGADDDRSNTKFGRRLDKIRGAYERGMRSAEGKDVVDGSLALMGSLSSVIGDKAEPTSKPPPTGFPFLERSDDDDSLPKWSRDIDTQWFDPCVRLIHAGGAQSLRDKKVMAFVYQNGMSRSDAEEIVDEAVFETCARHSKKHYPNVEAVFHQKARSRRINRYHKQRRRKRGECTAAVHELFYVPDEPSLRELIDFENALCQLDESDQQLLLLVASGHDAKEIGRRLGLAASTVRKRKERALKRIRARID